MMIKIQILKWPLNRHVADRPRDRANWEKFSEVLKDYTSLPLIINGDVFVHEDIEKVRFEIWIWGFGGKIFFWAKFFGMIFIDI